MAEAVKAVANLRHDKRATFIEGLAEEVKKELESDKKKDRPQLVSMLSKLAYFLEEAGTVSQKIWGLSKKHM